MNNTNTYDHNAPVLRKASRNRCLIAFLITSLAAFLLIGLTWPLTMKGYRSEGLIEFENQEVASSLVKTALPSVLRSAMSPAAMNARLEEIRSSTASGSSLLDAQNLEELYRRISVGFREGSSAQKPRLRIVLAGTGTADEARFIESFANDVSMRLDAAAHAGSSTGLAAATSHHSINQAQWLVDQIEEGLASAKSQTAQLMAYNHALDQGPTFRNVGHIKQPAATKVDSLHQTLESVDVSSLRGVIEQFNENGNGEHSKLVRFDANTVSNQPVGAVPDAASLMLAGLISMLLGGVIAWNIQPFADTGFENIEDVTQQLGVPVIGTLKGGQPASESDKVGAEKSQLTHWANHAVRVGGTVLAAIAILGIGFWLTSAEVRNSFGESWFHGFARIVWKLSGA